MTKAMTLRLPDAAHEMLRTKAFTERTSITALVVSAIEGAWGKPATLCDERGCWSTPLHIESGGFHFCGEHHYEATDAQIILAEQGGMR